MIKKIVICLFIMHAAWSEACASSKKENPREFDHLTGILNEILKSETEKEEIRNIVGECIASATEKEEIRNIVGECIANADTENLKQRFEKTTNSQFSRIQTNKRKKLPLDNSAIQQKILEIFTQQQETSADQEKRLDQLKKHCRPNVIKDLFSNKTVNDVFRNATLNFASHKIVELYEATWQGNITAWLPRLLREQLPAEKGAISLQSLVLAANYIELIPAIKTMAEYTHIRSKIIASINNVKNLDSPQAIKLYQAILSSLHHVDPILCKYLKEKQKNILPLESKLPKDFVLFEQEHLKALLEKAPKQPDAQNLKDASTQAQKPA